MREIKFRAWIPDIKRIYQVMSVEVEPQDGRQKYIIVWEHPCVKSAIIKRKVGKFRLGDGVVLLEYTGLKDKKGKEIYEGHVLSIPLVKSTSKPMMSTRVVSFVDGFFGTVHEHGGHTYKTALTSYAFFDEVEIIGYEYENPELLEVT